MCQAYDGERRAILASEDAQSIMGFIAALAGKPITDNPHKYGKYDKEAWEHGWRCFHEGIIPWGLEKKYRDKVKLETVKRACDRFRKTRKLSPGLKRVIERHKFFFGN